MSVVIEYHECKMIEVISERVLVAATWKCTHLNLDGQPCQTMVHGYGRVGFPAAPHVTTSEAITSWFEHQAKVSEDAKRTG